MEPRKIKLEEIMKGDTIRITLLEEEPGGKRCSWMEFTVRRIEKFAVWGKECFCWEFKGKEEIILLNRPLAPHKYKVGQKVRTDDGKLVVIKALRCMFNLPYYDIAPTDAYWYLHKESELTPIEDWEPKPLDYVLYQDKKCVLAWIDKFCTVGYNIYDGNGRHHEASLSELSKWETSHE